MNMGETNKCNLREYETLAEVVKNTSDKSFPVLHLSLPSL